MGKRFLLITIVLLPTLVFSCASTNMVEPPPPGVDPGAAVLPIISSPAADPGILNEVKGKSWTFEDPDEGTQGWYLVHDEFFQYRGRAMLSRDDTTFGNGMLRLDLDFSADRNFEWSEPAMKNIFNEPIELEGVTQFSFDFYMNPSLYRTGQFKAKVLSDKGIKVEAVCDTIDAGDNAGKGFFRAEVTIPIGYVVQGAMEEMYFSIAGCLIDYAGPVFFDNLRWE